MRHNGHKTYSKEYCCEISENQGKVEKYKSFQGETTHKRSGIRMV